MPLLSCDVVWQDRFSLDVRINGLSAKRRQQLALQGTFSVLSITNSNTIAVPNHHHYDGMAQQDDYWYFNANLGARTGQLRAR